jgi:predicted nucleotidyltransferase
MIKNKSDIIHLVQSHSEEIDHFGVSTIRLFGSYVKGLQTSESDVDVLIEFMPEKKNFDNFMGIAFLLEELFEQKVEIVTLESLSERMRKVIIESSEYVFRRN